MLLQGQHKHEAYTGDRTREAFEKFADSLVATAGQPHLKHADLKEAPKASGCNLAGAHKVPAPVACMLNECRCDYSHR
jgi:hypothetical protein